MQAVTTRLIKLFNYGTTDPRITHPLWRLVLYLLNSWGLIVDTESDHTNQEVGMISNRTIRGYHW